MQELISVIVPVYNVSNYIVECLESLKNQSYKNLEIVLIDDGSTDRSGEICDKYAALDGRFKVIHQKNGGAANAKNAGLKIASGTYLAFVDSDDYLEIDAYEHMMMILKRYDADIVQCCYREIFTNQQKDCVVKGVEKFTAEEYLCRYTKDWSCGLLWDKLYKRKLFENIYFEEGHIIDDEFFTYQGVMNAKKIVHDSKVIYNYRQRKSSVTVSEKYRNRIVLDKLDYLEKRRNNVIGKYPNLQKVFDKHLFSMIIWLSKDPNLTIDAIDVMKKNIKKYKMSRNCCNLSLRQQLYLLYLRLCSGNYILKKREYEKTKDIKGYFE